MLTCVRPRVLLVILAVSIIAGCARQSPKPIAGKEPTKYVSGKVVKIVDGDTITILDSTNAQHKIRLAGIDAPEHNQAFGQVSKDNLAGLVFGKLVAIEYDKVDRWGRLVGKVGIEGNDECLEQIKAGLAWHYKEYAREQSPADQKLYANAEQEARQQKRGLWQDSNPTAPWDFRHHATGSPADSDVSDEAPASAPQTTSARSSADRLATTPASSTLNNKPAPSVRRTTISNATTTLDEAGLIRGNKHSMIYHWPGCPNYDDIAPHNRVPFQTREEAEKAGYCAARNCR